MQFSEFAGIPAVGSAYKITGDTLDGLKLHPTFRAVGLIHIRILVAALRAMITVMVYGAVPHILLVHHVYNLHDGFLIVSGISIDFYIKYMSAAGERMIGSLHFGLVAR